MKIIKTTLPSSSLLNVPGIRYSYEDSYKVVFTDTNDKVTIEAVCKAFFSAAPRWVRHLFALRNRLVSVTGLKTPGRIINRQQMTDSFTCTPGERSGLFKIFDKTNTEIILGEDDKHLDFRVSLLLKKPPKGNDQKELTVSTTVIFHNHMGRLYFLPVKPFHRLIVPAMLKNIMSRLAKNNIE